MAKVMIIDDSGTARSRTRLALEEALHTAIEASGGEEALKFLSQMNDIQLVLCDFNMPKMDGLEVCKKIKANPKLAHIKLLMLTTESSPEMRAKGKEIGILGWVTKPFELTKLIAAINKLVI